MVPRGLRRRLRFLPLFRREEGQAAFEFVLILPFFVLFLLLLIDFGIMMYEYVSVSNAVREGARYGAVNCGDGGCSAPEVAQRVVERSGGVLPNAARVTVEWINNDGQGTNHDRGDSVAVKVCHPYHFLFFPAAKINVVSSADMRLEQTDKGTGTGVDPGCE